MCSVIFFVSSRRRHKRWTGDWSSDVCSSDLCDGHLRPEEITHRPQPAFAFLGQSGASNAPVDHVGYFGEHHPACRRHLTGGLEVLQRGDEPAAHVASHDQKTVFQSFFMLTTSQPCSLASGMTCSVPFA